MSDREKLIDTLITKYHWTKEDCQNKTDHILQRNIQIEERKEKEKIEDLKKFDEERPSLTDYGTNPDVSLENSLKYLQIEDVEENVKIAAKNNLRTHLGLEELIEQPIPQEMDYEALLLLDEWEIGQHIKAWLKKYRPSQQDNYRRKFEDMIAVRKINNERMKEDVTKWQKIKTTFDKLKNAPVRTINDVSGQVKVNPKYLEYKKELEEFYHKLENTAKYLNVVSEKPFFAEDFQEIYSNIKEKFKRHNKK